MKILLQAKVETVGMITLEPENMAELCQLKELVAGLQHLGLHFSTAQRDDGSKALAFEIRRGIILPRNGQVEVAKK